MGKKWTAQQETANMNTVSSWMYEIKPNGTSVSYDYQAEVSGENCMFRHFDIDVLHWAMSVSQHAQIQVPDTDTTEWSTGIINLICYTCLFRGMASQNVCCDKGVQSHNPGVVKKT